MDYEAKREELSFLVINRWIADRTAIGLTVSDVQLKALQNHIFAALKQADEARAEQREACAKIICPNCRDGVPLKDSGTHVHTALSGATFEAACHAAAIRNKET